MTAAKVSGGKYQARKIHSLNLLELLARSNLLIYSIFKQCVGDWNGGLRLKLDYNNERVPEMLVITLGGLQTVPKLLRNSYLIKEETG